MTNENSHRWPCPRLRVTRNAHRTRPTARKNVYSFFCFHSTIPGGYDLASHCGDVRLFKKYFPRSESISPRATRLPGLVCNTDTHAQKSRLSAEMCNCHACCMVYTATGVFFAVSEFRPNALARGTAAFYCRPVGPWTGVERN